MKSTYRYSLGTANRHKEIIKLIDDYKFEKHAEVLINSSLQDSVDTLSRQINTLNARNYEFEEYSFVYLNSNIISIEEALLLMIGFNPDVLSNKNFHQFNLSNNAIGLLETLIIHRVNEYNILERNVFSGQSQVKTDKFIKFAISNNYFSRSLSTPKTATYKNKIKNQNNVCLLLYLIQPICQAAGIKHFSTIRVSLFLLLVPIKTSTLFKNN